MTNKRLSNKIKSFCESCNALNLSIMEYNKAFEKEFNAIKFGVYAQKLWLGDKSYLPDTLILYYTEYVHDWNEDRFSFGLRHPLQVLIQNGYKLVFCDEAKYKPDSVFNGDIYVYKFER